MIYGIEDYDLTIDDLEILIKFINLKTYKTKEFADKLIVHLHQNIFIKTYFIRRTNVYCL